MTESIETWAEAMFEAAAKNLTEFVHDGQTYILLPAKDENAGTFIATMGVADGSVRYLYRVEKG